MGKWFILKIILSYAMSLGVQVYHVVSIQIRKKEKTHNGNMWMEINHQNCSFESVRIVNALSHILVANICIPVAEGNIQL